MAPEPVASTTSAESPAQPPGRAAGFWIRFVADSVDALLLMAVGFALVKLAPALVDGLGEQGVFVGLTLSLAYHAVLHSKTGRGRTLGKRLLGLRVVRMDGSFLSLDRSLVRAGMMSFLIYNGAVISGLSAAVPALSTPIAVVGAFVATMLFLGCVCIVPFHPLKRGLHDLLTDALVIRGAMPDADVIKRGTSATRDRRFVLRALAIAAILFGGGFLVGRFHSPMVQLAGLQEAVAGRGLQNVAVSDVVVTNASGRSHDVVVTGVVRQSQLGAGARSLHDAVVADVQAKLGAQHDFDSIRTVLVAGVNLGVYQSYTTVENETKLSREVAPAATAAP